MEEGTFQTPAVAGELTKNWVEARLHCDAEPPIPGNAELEKKYSGTEARPTYVIVDPRTLESIDRERGWMSESAFLKFLRGD